MEKDLTQLKIRIAEQEDLKDIFVWRNDPLSIRMSKTSKKIQWDDHLKWFSNALETKSRVVLICENYMDEKIACVIFFISEFSAEVSINLNPAHRGKRLSQSCLKQSIEFFSKEYADVKKLTAFIKEKNIISKKIFMNLGFKKVNEQDAIGFYENKLFVNDTKMIRFSDQHQDLVLKWRNDPDVRENMYTYHLINEDEHKDWFQSLLSDSSRRFFIFTIDGEPSGVIGFTNIDLSAKSACWVFYSADTSKRGVGSMMEVAALNYAFDEMKLNKLYCEVLEFNDSVISFHRKHGFKVEGIFKKHFYKDKKYWDIYRLAIFRETWMLSKVSLENRKQDPFKVGTKYTHEFTITENQISDFANVTGDYNSIHSSDEFARGEGFCGKIVHGFLGASVFSKIFGTLFPGEGTIYINQSLKFFKPVYPNTSLKAECKILSRIGSRIEVDTRIFDCDTEELLLSGEASLITPLNIGEIK